MQEQGGCAAPELTQGMMVQMGMVPTAKRLNVQDATSLPQTTSTHQEQALEGNAKPTS